MGGNAFPNTYRLDAAAYHTFAARMVESFKDLTPTTQIEVIKSYKNKESFGDLDLLITGAKPEDLYHRLKSSMKSTDSHVPIEVNGPVVSVGYGISESDKVLNKVFQTDFIFVKEEEFDFASSYFAYNDLGNLIGQTAHGLGLKFGHNGLWYKYIEGTEFLGDILITQNFNEALELLGYSSKGYWHTDFNTLEDVFTFAVSSDYFSTWNYQLENRNHVGRIRDRKRGTYMKFLEWMKDKGLPSNPPDKEKGILLANRYHRHVGNEFIQLTLDRQLRDKAKFKFNGSNLSYQTGLQGKELGNFMQSIKAKFETPKQFLKSVVRMSGQEFNKFIDDEFEKYKQEK